MQYDPYYAELSADGCPTIRLNGKPATNQIGLLRDGLDGWYSTPTVKVSTADRGNGDGGHDIPADGIHYASRTVQIKWNANADNRDSLLAMCNQLRLFAHKLVTLRVVDATADTYCAGGYLSLDQDGKWLPHIVPDSGITIVFQRPERLATSSQRLQLAPTSTIPTGLRFDDEYAETPGRGLLFPLNFGDALNDGRNRGTLINHGTSPAYPTITVNGDWPDGVLILLGTTSALRYDAPIYSASPVTFDARSRTATCNGVDATHYLTTRGFATVPSHGTLPVVVASEGNGWVVCESADTYM